MSDPEWVISALLASPATSPWLKRALSDASRLDPVDAATDAELLAEVLSARARVTADALVEHFAAASLSPSDGEDPSPR